jgi:hypothetical protein
MAQLIFCATKEGMTRRIAERREMDGQDPFVLQKGSDIPGAIAALRADRNVVANAHAGAIGWSAPDGVTVDLDEDMQDERLEALRFQSEARVHRAGRVPSRVEFLKSGPDIDVRIRQTLREKVADPFSAASAPPVGPESP